MATAEQVERAEAELVEAKKSKNRAKVDRAKDKVVKLRQEFRAGRTGLVGGDARKVD